MNPTPRDQRIAVLTTLSHDELIDRAAALGYVWPYSVQQATTNDELISLIIDAETEIGVTSR